MISIMNVPKDTAVPGPTRDSLRRMTLATPTGIAFSTAFFVASVITSAPRRLCPTPFLVRRSAEINAIAFFSVVGPFQGVINLLVSQVLSTS